MDNYRKADDDINLSRAEVEKVIFSNCILWVGQCMKFEYYNG